MTGTLDDLTEILKLPKSSRSSSSTSSSAAATSAPAGSAVAIGRRWSGSEPELAPMRSGVPVFCALRTTASTLSGPPMLPGLMRTPATPVSSARSASEELKWMSAMIGRPAAATMAGSASASGMPGHGHAHDVGAGLAQTADLLERRLDVVRLGRRHRLHADRGTAPDRDAADLDLSFARHPPQRIRGRGALYGPGRAPSRMRPTSCCSTNRKSTTKPAMPISETRS